MAKDDIYLFNTPRLKGILEVLTRVDKDKLSAFWKNAHVERLTQARKPGNIFTKLLAFEMRDS